MSAEAAGYVWKCSPYRGATFIVHHAIADVANDLHEHKFWMSMGKLASKARITKFAARKAVQRLVADGFLEVVEQYDVQHWKTTTYRFLFPKLPPGNLSCLPLGNDVAPLGNDDAPIPSRSQSEQPKLLAIARTRARKVPWPDDFVLTDELAAYATRQGLDAKYQWGKFKIHALRDDERHVNWVRAWEYWVRNAWEIDRRHG